MRKILVSSLFFLAIMIGSISTLAQEGDLTIKRTVPLGKDMFFDYITASENGFVIAGINYNDPYDDEILGGQVIGYDNNGNFLWKYKAPLNLTGITTVDDGYVAVGRGYNNKATVCQIFKLDYSGNLVWSEYLNINEGSWIGFDSVAANSTNIFAVGNTSSCSFIAKYDMIGNLIWKKEIKNSDVFEITVSDNQCVAAGLHRVEDATGVLAFDTNGNLLWETNIPELNIFDIEETQDGYIVAGEDQYIVKLDTNGKILWGRTSANDARGGWFCNAYENESGYIAFGRGWEIFTNEPHNAVYVQYDKNGNLLYEKETDFINKVGADKAYNDVAKTKNGYVGIGETAQYHPMGYMEYIVIFEENQGIRITNVTISTTDGISRDLKNPRTSIGFLKQERETSLMSLQDEYNSTLNASVDWGNNPKGQIFLRGDTSGIEIPLEDGTASVDLASIYPAGETFTLVAQTISNTNEVKTEKLKLPIDVVSFTANFFPETNPVIGMQNIPLFEDMVLTPGFTVEEDAGLFNRVIRNGVLTIELSKDDDTFSFFNNKKMPAEVYGRLNIPVFNAKNGIWSGEVKVNMLPKSLFKTRKNLFYYIPWTASVGADGAVNGQYSISYQSGKWIFEGAVVPEVSIEIFGGAGIDTGNNALKVGLVGEGALQLPFYFRTDGIAFEPNGAISAGIRGEIKCFKFVDVQKDLNLLNVSLSKNGWRGTAFDGGIQLFGLDEANVDGSFELASRKYITNETGFVDSNVIKLLSDTIDETIVYKNAASYSEGTICDINGELYMFFAEDDTSRLTQNGLNLIYSKLGKDGCWSIPVAVEDDGTLDSSVSTSGNFLIWEDCTKVLSESENLLSDSLMNTGITAAKINENGAIDVFEIENSKGYHYSPDIWETENGAVAMWMSSSNADILNNSGSYDISVAIYDGGKWEKKTLLTDLTELGKSQLVCCENDIYVFYKIKDSLYCYDNKTNETTFVCENIKQYFATQINGKVSMAYFDVNNQLFYSTDVLNKSVEHEKLSDGSSNGVANNLKISVINDGVYIYWITHHNGKGIVKAIIKNTNGEFSKEITLMESDDTIKEATLEESYNNVYLSYFSEENSLTEEGMIKTQNCNFHITDIEQAADLAIVQENFAITNEGNNLYAAFTIENKGLINSENFTVDILCEETTVYSELQDGLSVGDSRTSVVPINKYGKGVHTYKIKIIPVGLDINHDNNSYSTLYNGINLNIKDAYEVILSDKRTMEVEVENNGICDTGGTIVVKAQDGTVVSEKSDYFSTRGSNFVTIPLDKDLKPMLLEVEINCDNDGFDGDNKLLVQCGTVAEMPLSIGNVSVNDKLDISFTTSYDSSDNIDTVFYVACYDGENCLVGTKSEKHTISNNETYFDVSLSEWSKETYEIKIFIWESQTLKPLSKAITIYK